MSLRVRACSPNLIAALTGSDPDGYGIVPFRGHYYTLDSWAGLNALPALAGEGYRRGQVSLRDLASTGLVPRRRRVARQYARTGAAEGEARPRENRRS